MVLFVGYCVQLVMSFILMDYGTIVQFILKSLRNVAPVSLFLNVALPSFELKGFLICPNVN